MNESNVSGDKEKLIRGAFALWTQIGYGKFHADFFKPIDPTGSPTALANRQLVLK